MTATRPEKCSNLQTSGDGLGNDVRLERLVEGASSLRGTSSFRPPSSAASRMLPALCSLS